MAKVGNGNIRKQGMCVGACCVAFITTFRKQLFSMGDVKESLFKPSFPAPQKLPIRGARSAAAPAVKNGDSSEAGSEHKWRVPRIDPNVASRVEIVRFHISHHGFPSRALGFVTEIKRG